MSKRKKMKFGKILKDYPFSNKDIEKLDKMIEEGMDLETEYKAVMNKTSHYTRAMRDLIAFAWENRGKLKKQKEQGERKSRKNFVQNIFRRKKDE